MRSRGDGLLNRRRLRPVLEFELNLPAVFSALDIHIDVNRSAGQIESMHGWFLIAAELIRAADTRDAAQKKVIAALKGHKISVVSGADLAEYKTLLSPVVGEWLADMKSKKLDGDKVLVRTKEIIAQTK